jgi:Na+/proline symporter
MGLFTTAYTALGGIQAVIWTDVIQFTAVISGVAVLYWMALGHIHGGLKAAVLIAALNVVVQESIPLSSPLRAFPNVILTPHNSAHSEDARIQWQATVANSIEALVRGYWPPFPANPGIQPRAPLQPWAAFSSVYAEVPQ